MSKKNLTELSTKEEVAEYLSKEYEFNDQIKQIFLDEYISGDVLCELTEADLKKLKFKLGHYKKITRYISENKNNFKERKYEEKIYPNSTKEEVKQFFEKCIEFKGDLNDTDGKKLLEMKEEEMDKLGLKFCQKKRLIKYINYFKTLKPPEEENILITRKSSEQDVSKFLKFKLRFSQDSIDDLCLDGGTLFELTENDIDTNEQMNEEEKKNLKSFLRESSLKIPEPEIQITDESSMDDIYIFLQKKMGFSEDSIKILKEVELAPSDFFILTDENIDVDLEGLSGTEKEKLKDFLKKYRKEKIAKKKEIKIDNESTKDEVINYLKNKLNFSENSIKKWELDGKQTLSLTENDIDKIKTILEEEKKALKKYINEQKQVSAPSSTPTPTTTKEETIKEKKDKEPKDNESKKEKEENVKDKIEIKINKESKKEDIIKFLEKHNLSLEKLTKEELEKINDLSKEEKDIISDFLSNDKIKRANKIQDILFNEGKPSLQLSIKTQNLLNPNNNDSTNKAMDPKTIIKKKKKDGIEVEERHENPEDKNKVKEGEQEDKKFVEEKHFNKKKQKSEKKKFYAIEKLKVKHLEKPPYNIFFFLAFTKLSCKNINISTYQDESTYFSSYYCNIKCNLISKNEYKNEKNGEYICYLFQVPSEKLLKNLGVAIKKKKEESMAQIDIQNIQNYFQMSNIQFYSNDDSPFLDINTIFSEYLDYFLSKKEDIEENIQPKFNKSHNKKNYKRK